MLDIPVDVVLSMHVFSLMVDQERGLIFVFSNLVDGFSRIDRKSRGFRGLQARKAAKFGELRACRPPKS